MFTEHQVFFSSVVSILRARRTLLYLVVSCLTRLHKPPRKPRHEAMAFHFREDVDDLPVASLEQRVSCHSVQATASNDARPDETPEA